MRTDDLKPHSIVWALAILLAFAVAFGGGGSKYGLANLVVQLTALTALAVHREEFFRFWKTAPLALRILIGLTFTLPALQILPLPASVWTALPGRDLVVQSFELLGESGETSRWASLSVDPVRTTVALTALITPLAVLAVGWSAPRDRLVTVGWIAVGLGLINFLLGVPQVLTNSETGVLYPENPMPGVLFGTFANRNTTGLFLVATLALAAILPPPARAARHAPLLRGVICALLVLAVVLTRSRTALVLAMIPLGLAGLRMLLVYRKGDAIIGHRRGWFVLIPTLLIVALLGAVLITSPGRVGMVMERFEGSSGDARVHIWEDSAYAASRYWPVGSGMGTFDDVFQIDESLENMSVKRAGRAHNDYLEIAIEAGVPGIALVAGWLVILVWLAWRARRSPDRWIAWSGAAILAVIALQSITDYPLRNQTMLALGSFGLLLLARFGKHDEDARMGEAR